MKSYTAEERKEWEVQDEEENKRETVGGALRCSQTAHTTETNTETETNRGDSKWQQLMEDIKASKLRENLEAVDSKNAFRS